MSDAQGPTGAPDPTPHERVPRWPARVAWTLVSLAVLLHGWLLWLITTSPARLPLDFGIGVGSQVATAVLGVTYGVVGAIVLGSWPRNAVAWVFVAVGVTSAIGSVFMFWPSIALAAGAHEVASLLAVIASVNLQSGFALFGPLVLLLFPDGRFLAPGWRWVAVLAVVAALIHAAEVLFAMPTAGFLSGHVNPFAGPDGPKGGLMVVPGTGLTLGLVAFLLASASAVLRYRAADGIERLQLTWFAWGAGVAVATSLPVVALWRFGSRTSGDWGEVLGIVFLLGATLIPVAAGIAILRYRLYDIDRIVNRTILYGALTAILAGLVAGLITLTQRLLINATGETSDVALVLVALIATATYTPLRKRLEAVIDRRFGWESGFGPWRADLERVLAATDETVALGRLLDEAVRELHASGGAIVARRGRRWELVAHAGEAWGPGATPPPPAHTVPLHRGDTVIAELRLGDHVDGGRFEDRACSELRDLAGIVARTVRMHGPGSSPRVGPPLD